MITHDLLEGEFNFIGVDGLEDEILVKCIELGTRYKIDAERFVEEWIAFAQTNLNGNLKPTTVTLDMMERKQLSKKQEKPASKEIIEKSTSSIKVYKSGNTADVNNILNVYNEVTPKKSGAPVKSDNLDTSTNFSPATYNPEVVKPSTAYAERKDKGQILEAFGIKDLLNQDTEEFPKNHNITVKLLNKSNWNASNSRYMFEVPKIESSVINARIESLGLILKQKYCEDQEEHEKKDTSVTYGRIRCDGDRLNAYSIILETSLQHGNGQVALINLSKIPRYALFPGQIVMLNATLQMNNNRKSVLYVNKLYWNVMPDLPKQIPVLPPGNGPLKIVVACGPYTLSDNLVYQPLQDLIKYVLTNCPDVLVLVGPFVDKRHSSVADGTMAETYLAHFENLMEKVISPLQHTDIKIIVIPSVLDAHHHSVYPTPPFQSLPKHNKFISNNIFMSPDPSLIDVNGIIVGVTSADVLFHLAKTEFNFQPENSDRMARFAQHVLSQRSFYPLYPAQASIPGQKRFPLDLQSLKVHGNLDIMPHILILPSNLKQFVRNVSGCIVINPERLSKGFVGGTFAAINIYPGQMQESVAENITCRIIKI